MPTKPIKPSKPIKPIKPTMPIRPSKTFQLRRWRREAKTLRLIDVELSRNKRRIGFKQVRLKIASSRKRHTYVVGSGGEKQK